MTFDTAFASLWNRFAEFEVPQEQVPVCSFAQTFSAWASDLVTTATTKQDLILINQAKVQLMDKYFEWRAYVPKAHRERTGRRSGHICIFHIFADAYHTLKVAELSLTPPLLFLPEPPPSPALPQIAGIFLGELDEE